MAVPQPDTGDVAGAIRRPVLSDSPASRSNASVTLQPGLGGHSYDRLDAAGIDPDLRWRVSSEIASFLAVFDAFLTDNSAESYDQLLGATDRLMRVAARTRIELERARTSEHSQLGQANPATNARSRAIAS
ncbi:MAG TPA: hypothetical protein VD978_22660 [Azospirillum sp.]|nr:hypothetical protein [Azospirillum sp.]